MAKTIIKDSATRILQVNPSLSYAEVARLLGVSRERIRQVANVCKRHPRFCNTCGKQIRLLDNGVTQTAYYQGYCHECWEAEKERRRKAHHQTFTCEWCGALFTRKAGTVKRQEELGLKIRWCSKHCQGKWLAANYKSLVAGRN
jgi:hypothetical protein